MNSMKTKLSPEKKRIYLMLTCMVVGVMMFSFALILLFNKPEDQTDVPQKECVFHVDENEDSICDVCNTELNLPSPEQPDNNEQKPDDNPPTIIDFTSDVNNAVQLFNSMIDITIDIDTLPAHLRFAASLMKLASSPNLMNLIKGNVTNISINGDKMVITSQEGSSEWQHYLLLKDGGLYLVTTNGEYTETAFEKIDTTLDLSIIPTATTESLTYDAESGYFVFSEEYVESTLILFVPTLNLLPNDSNININDVFNDLTYSAKFKVSSTNVITEFVVKGTSTENDLSSDVLAFTYKKTDTNTKIASTLNYLVVVRNSIEYNVISEDKAELRLEYKLTPPLGLPIDKQDISYVAEVNLKDNTIVFPNPILDQINELRLNINKEGLIAEKYKDGLTSTTTCKNVAFYDEEVKEYILFTYNPTLGKYVYCDFYKTYDENVYCLAEIENNQLVIVEHYPNEKEVSGLSEKYAGEFTSMQDMDLMVVLDPEFNVYVRFEKQYSTTGNKYLYTGYLMQYVYEECLASVNMETKTLTIIDAPRTQLFAETIRYTPYTCADEMPECKWLFVWHDAGNQYIAFEKADDGYWYCCGYFSWGGYCIGTVDTQNHTVTLSRHSHSQ